MILLEEPWWEESTDRERGKGERLQSPDGGNVNVNIFRVSFFEGGGLDPSNELGREYLRS